MAHGALRLSLVTVAVPLGRLVLELDGRQLGVDGTRCGHAHRPAVVEIRAAHYFARVFVIYFRLYRVQN